MSAVQGSLSTAALLAACGAGALVVNLLIVRHGFSPETISFWRSAWRLGEHLSGGQWAGGVLLMGSIWGLSEREARQHGVDA